MANKILFSVHRNPQPDSNGADTYQVRHENTDSIDTTGLLDYLQASGLVRREVMETALVNLQEQIAYQLTSNKRLHLNGIGTFFLKVGFRKRFDDEGNLLKPHFTDPNAITGHDLCIEGIGFTPDSLFMERLSIGRDFSFQNISSKGSVGKSESFDLDELKHRLGDYLDQHGHITRSEFCRVFHLTRYLGAKTLSLLSQDEDAFLTVEWEGNVKVYRRRK